MKKILVPTDFSQPSLASFLFAVEIASRTGAEIFVVHMIELPLLPETTFGVQPYPIDPQLIKDLELGSTQAFEEMKSKFAGSARVTFHVVHDRVVSGIRMFEDQHKIDLVIMSTHGASALDEFFIGSTAEKIARFSRVPLIAVPKEVKFERVKNIVVPNNLEDGQGDLVRHLKDLQKLFNAKLHILLINTPFHFYTNEEAQNLLEKFAKDYNLQDFTLNFRNDQSERTGILKFMEEVKGDMIAMATHGRTGLAHFFQGSIAESVLNRVDQPIWTYKVKK
jgi:nucleotide-binding universal stress UspA family protein